MWKFRSAVNQCITQRLINDDGARGNIEADRPWRGQLRLRRKIQTQCNAKLALFAVGVLFQLRAAQVRCQINVGRLDRLACDGTDDARNLMMEEARYAFIVSYVATRALIVTKPNGAAPDFVTVVAAECGKVKG